MERHNRVKALAKPFEYAEYRAKKVAAKLAERAGSRLGLAAAGAAAAKLPAVNRELAERLLNLPGACPSPTLVPRCSGPSVFPRWLEREERGGEGRRRRRRGGGRESERAFV